jgi:hypothetical protein
MDNSSQIPVLRQSVTMEIESDQLFLYCKDTRFYATLDNDVASTVLKLCDGNRSLNQITEAIFSEYESKDQEEVSKDLRDMFQILERESFIDFK